MPIGLSGTTRLLTRVRARVVAVSALTRGGWGLVPGAVGAGLWIAIGKFIGEPWSADWRLAAGTAAAGMVIGVVTGVLRAPSLLSAAAMADAAIGSQDRLRAAIELVGRSDAKGDPFVASLALQAEQIAMSADARKVVVLKGGRGWMVGLPAAAMAVAAAIFVPLRESTGQEAVERREERLASVGAAASAVAAAREVISEMPATSETFAGAEQIRRLEELEEELRSGLESSNESRARAASAASELSDRAEEAARRNERAAQRLSEIARNAAESEERDAANQEPTDARLGSLMERLAAGDLGRAAEEIDELAQDAPEMTPEERERLANQLESLASRLEEAATEGAKDAQSDTELGDADVPSHDVNEATTPGEGESRETSEQLESRDEPLPADTAGETAESARERVESGDPDTAEREAADPIAESEAKENRTQAQREREAAEDAERDAREIAKGARESAEQIRRSGPEDRGEARERGSEGPQEQPQQGDRVNERQQGTEGGESAPGNKDAGARERRSERSEGAQQDGERQQGEGARQQEEQGSKDRADGSPPGERGEESDQQDGEERREAGERTSGENPNAGERRDGEQAGETSDGGRQGIEQEQGGDQRESQGTGEERGLEQGGERGAEQGERTGDERGGGQGVPPRERGQGQQMGRQQDDGQRQPEGPMGAFRRAVERAAGRERAAEEQRYASERLRQIADDLSRSEPPGENQMPGPAWKPDLSNREGPDVGGAGAERGDRSGEEPRLRGGFEVEDVEGPRREPGTLGGRVAGERPSDGTAVAAPIAPVTPSRLREAVDGAERAIEQQGVPDRRGDLVRRVFRRYSERAAMPGVSPAPSQRQPEP